MPGTAAGAQKRARCPECGMFQHASPECPPLKRTSRPVMDRLWEKVDIRGEDECWEWQGFRLPSGYGQIDKQYVHRLVAGAEKGETVRHSCDNPPCCNPRHLIRGTQQENMDDMVAKGRSNRGERHPLAKLTAAQVRAVREDPRPSTVVAAEYPVTARTIRKIRRAERWQHEKDTT